MPKVMIELPEKVFREIMKMQGSVKEIVERIVAESITGKPSKDGLKKVERENQRLEKLLKEKEREIQEREREIRRLKETVRKERLKSAECSEVKEELLKQLHELEVDNRELQELLSETVDRLEALQKVNDELVVKIRQGVKEAFRELLREYETAGFKLQKTFLEKCRQIIVAVNKYLDSADEVYRVRLYPKDNSDILVATIVNLENPFHNPPERVYKTVTSMIRGLDADGEIKVEITDDGKYLLLRERQEG